MQYIQRKIESDQEQFESNKIRVDIIDGRRLSIRCKRTDTQIEALKKSHAKVRPEIVVNFTEDETKKIKHVLGRSSIGKVSL